MKKKPVVAIIGFPNVGKSTLFNRLLGKKKSLTHSLPGMTRDRIPALLSAGDKTVLLVDTGGIFETGDDPFSTQVKEKAWEASREADLILFVLDARRGLLPAEEELFRALKRLDKPVLAVVNKVDSPGDEDKAGEFFRLGEETVFMVSAEHKRNLDILEDRIFETVRASRHRKAETAALNIAIVGRINVGKSSLVNRLCGEERLIVSELPGTTRDSTDTLIVRQAKEFCLVDTAGIRKLSRTRDGREKAGIIKAKKDIVRADIICFILDALDFPTRQDTAIAHLARESGKPLIIALNKWDLVAKQKTTAEEFERRVYAKMEFVDYAPLLFVSARTGKGVVKILDLALRVHLNTEKQIQTSRLNEFLQEFIVRYPPLSRRRSRFNFKYMTQVGVRPPTFALFTHSRESLLPSYEKFLINRLRDRFDFQGTPLRIRLKRS